MQKIRLLPVLAVLLQNFVNAFQAHHAAKNVGRTSLVHERRARSRRSITHQQHPRFLNRRVSLTKSHQGGERLRTADSSPKSPSFRGENFIQGANAMLSKSVEESPPLQQEQTCPSSSPMNRRFFVGSSLLGASAVVSMTAIDAQPAAAFDTESYYSGKLEWQTTPINKRTGISLTDAEKAGYNVRFVTYLARFLLVFDNDCQRWWYSRAADIPPLSSADQVEKIRLKQFGAFAASVEVGLQDYLGGRGRRKVFGGSDEEQDGPQQLMEALLERYCPTLEAVREDRERRELPPLTEQEEARERREIKEARRQIALLFGLLEETQPVEELNKLLASIDNGSISSVKIIDGGTGYAPGYGPPNVEFPPPKAGDNYRPAKGRAILEPNGQILRIDLANRGFGYSTAPTVEISPPGADRGIVIPGAKGATAKAFVFKNGVNKGRLERIQIEDPGAGYNEGEKIRVVISPPELAPQDGGQKATAQAILEYSVAAINITDGGTGYAVEKQIPVYVDPPPLTARINLNDPLMARVVNPTKPLPPTIIPTAQQLKKTTSNTNSSDPNSFTAVVNRLASNNGLGGGGGCIGRSCYDKEVVALASATAETSSFSTFRKESDARRIVQAEEALMKNRVISGASAGLDSQLPAFWNGGPSSNSGQLLTLLPPGIGLEFNPELKRFTLSASPDFLDINEESTAFSGSARPLDPEFGPRGRSPVERDLTLDLSSFLRFCASGAVCASGVHLLVTPLDVIKTKIQTDPDNYPDPVTAFQKLVKDQGLTGFFSGWQPTFVGFFCWGGFSYSLTELLRRYLNDLAGVQSSSLEVPIILVSSAVSATVGTFILVPFESVRIRSVAQPGYAKNFVQATQKMVKEEGVGSLFSAVPPFLLKEIPFTMAKFVIFSQLTTYLYQQFPAAQEDIQLSLLVSLASGIVGGAVAAIVSNPADATISEMKKTKSNITPIDAAKGLIEKGGYANMMRGLPVRMAFYPLVVSLQFLVYDAVRIYLGIGQDDLKVYLDVLGGALKKSGSMIGPA